MNPFFKDMNGTGNHRILLFAALELTTGKVIEYGSGHQSTPHLAEYCDRKDREFESFENNAEWAAQTQATLIPYWHNLPPAICDVLLIDHAPGEQREFDIVKNKDSAKIIVVHDTEIAADHGYNVRHTFKQFKFAAEINPDGGGAGAAILSNHFDVTQFIGEKLMGDRVYEIVKIK
jgi:hypothetical protein